MRLALSNTRAAAGRLLDACWMEAASIRLPSVIFQVDRLMVITMDTLAAQRNIQQHRRQTSSGQDSKLPDYVQTVVVKGKLMTSLFRHFCRFLIGDNSITLPLRNECESNDSNLQ